MFSDYSWFNGEYTMAESVNVTDEETLKLAADWKKRINMSMKSMINDYFKIYG